MLKEIYKTKKRYLKTVYKAKEKQIKNRKYNYKNLKAERSEIMNTQRTFFEEKLI